MYAVLNKNSNFMGILILTGLQQTLGIGQIG